MEQRTTWEEMKVTYPNEWIAIIDEEGDVEAPYGNICGIVLTHHADEHEFTRLLKPLMLPDRLVDIRYSGEVLPENPVGPVLWQISHTIS